MRQLADAQLALGRLDGSSRLVPNPDLFVGMYVRREAVRSAQIEGTVASLADVLQFELDDKSERPADVEEVVNYVAAVNLGFKRLAVLPVSLRLIREVHARLLRGVRGSTRSPGVFRRNAVWLGGTSIETALYVPPSADLLPGLLRDFEQYLHDETVPPIVLAALAHAQFETIHPFNDGNGRMGRLLIALILGARGVLQRPLLYLSDFLKGRRAEYYDRLQRIRTHGDWEGWLAFFLEGVAATATEANDTAQKILRLKTGIEARLRKAGRSAGSLLAALDVLFEQPITSAAELARRMKVSIVTANRLLPKLVELGVVTENTGRKRDRSWRFGAYLRLFDSDDRGEE